MPRNAFMCTYMPVIYRNKRAIYAIYKAYAGATLHVVIRNMQMHILCALICIIYAEIFIYTMYEPIYTLSICRNMHFYASVCKYMQF